MSTIAQSLRLHRIRRFGEVVRQEGLRKAIKRARLHLRLLSQGHGRSEFAAPRQVGVTGSRFAQGPIWRELAARGAFHVSTTPAVLSRRRRIAVIGDLNLPQCRKYRVEQMDEFWSALGVGYSFAHFEDVPRCREILQGATHLVLYRLHRCDLVTMHLYEARRLRLPVLYDIDDPLFSVSAYSAYSNMSALSAGLQAQFLDAAPLYLDVMNGADALSLSTPGLVDHAASYSLRPAWLRRNFADSTTLSAGAAARRDIQVRSNGFTVAISSGSLGHEADFSVALEGLCAFLRGAAERQVVILGHASTDIFPQDMRDRVRVVPFTGYETYLNRLAAADCLVLPLTDDPFNRCKSAVRALDAAAVSVATVASAVGDLPAVVSDGRTGRIVRQNEWGSVLEDLAAAPRHTKDLGLAARADLEARWIPRPDRPVADPDLIRWVKG